MTYQAVHQGLILMQSPRAIGANPQQHTFLAVIRAAPFLMGIDNGERFSLLISGMPTPDNINQFRQ
jgi:hypothetical protein